MKLSYCKFNTPSLKEEVFKMNRFNVALTMRRLVVTMAALFIGMTIPAMVFKACDYMLVSYRGAYVGDFTGGVTAAFTTSSLLILGVAKWVALFMIILSIFKFIQSGDLKRFGKDMASIAFGYVLIECARFMPFAVPSMMRYMGYL